MDGTEQTRARCAGTRDPRADEVAVAHGRARGPARGRAGDRRAERTERALRDALAALLHEKPYGAIAVKEILARADVGRSTFYAHFTDKDALLARCVRDLLGTAFAGRGQAPTGRQDRVLRFGLPVLEFHARQRRAHAGPMDAVTRGALHARLEGLLATRVAAELRPTERRGARSGPGATQAVPTELVARHVAATFGLVLAWWLDQGDALAPGEADAHFRALVAPALAAAPDAAPDSAGV